MNAQNLMQLVDPQVIGSLLGGQPLAAGPGIAGNDTVLKLLGLRDNGPQPGNYFLRPPTGLLMQDYPSAAVPGTMITSEHEGDAVFEHVPGGPLPVQTQQRTIDTNNPLQNRRSNNGLTSPQQWNLHHPHDPNESV